MRDGVLFQNPKSGFQNLNPTLVSVADVFSDVTQRSPFWDRSVTSQRLESMNTYLICYSPL